MISEPTEASATAKVMAALRPTLSPIRPKNSPPKGRATKPTAKIAMVARNAEVASALEKSWPEMKEANVA